MVWYVRARPPCGALGRPRRRRSSADDPDWSPWLFLAGARAGPPREQDQSLTTLSMMCGRPKPIPTPSAPRSTSGDARASADLSDSGGPALEGRAHATYKSAVQASLTDAAYTPPDDDPSAVAFARRAPGCRSRSGWPQTDRGWTPRGHPRRRGPRNGRTTAERRRPRPRDRGQRL